MLFHRKELLWRMSEVEPEDKQSMSVYKMGILPGDGIGPEIVSATLDVLTAAALYHWTITFEWVELPMGWNAIREYGSAMPDCTKQALEHCDGWIMGPHDSASYPSKEREKRNPSGELRHHFDLYANIRPARTMPGLHSVADDADLVIVRENTEGFYPDRNLYMGSGEWMPTPDVAISVGVFTRKASERIAHTAFQLAMQRRKRVTIVHKANVIRLGTGLFLQVCREVAKQYPEVQVDDYHIDAMTAHLVRRVRDFDVIVTTNMFGDILSDLTGELVGSLGLAPSINASDSRAMAQAAHGAAPDIAGKGIANPVGVMISAVLLLRWLAVKQGDEELQRMALRMEAAIVATLQSGIRTADLGGDASTRDFTARVKAHLLTSSPSVF